MRSRAADLAVGALTLLLAWGYVAFASQPSLASFADDSVSYLVMAQQFTPWRSPPPEVAAAFAREAFYPPLFPLVLALSGAAYDFARAHMVTALLLAACLPPLYLLAVSWLGHRWGAATAVATAALLPSLWINVKGILSEPLFTLLLLAALAVLETRQGNRKRLWLLALLMAALALTRTVGLVVVAAYGLWALTRLGQPLRARLAAGAPAFAAAAAYAGWVLLRPAGTSDDYMQIVQERAQLVFSAANPAAAFAASVARQAGSIAEAWTGALLLFWVEGRPLRVALGGVVGALAVAGLVLRFVSGKADAWMIGAYLATFLIWPFYDQMTRFLFPIVPVLALYAYWTLGRALQAIGRPAVAGHALLAVLIASLSLPALAFVYQRARIDGPHALIIDWYRTPDLDRARARAGVHLELLEDMQAIRALTRPDDRVMWVAPSYIALLAQRRGVPAPPADLAPQAYRRAVRESGADYVFLSAYHPRDTIRDTAWQAGLKAMDGHAAVVRVRTGNADSVLLKSR